MTQSLSEKWLSPNTVIGTVVLIAFGIFVVWLIGQTDGEETVWTRRLLLFGSVEAIVFAAAGALFGVEIQQGRVRDAVTTANKQSERADRHATDAASGRALARAITSVSNRATSGQESGITGSYETALEGLSSLAQELFPNDPR